MLLRETVTKNFHNIPHKPYGVLVLWHTDNPMIWYNQKQNAEVVLPFTFSTSDIKIFLNLEILTNFCGIQNLSLDLHEMELIVWYKNGTCRFSRIKLCLCPSQNLVWFTDERRLSLLMLKFKTLFIQCAYAVTGTANKSWYTFLYKRKMSDITL